MSFDFSLVSAPFRMQPGLRRIGAGDAQLTANAPNGRHLREKMAVLAAFPHQALCRSTDFDVAPVLRRPRGEAARSSPRAFEFDESAGDRACASAPLLGWSVDATACRPATAIRRSASCCASLPPARPRRRPPLPRLRGRLRRPRRPRARPFPGSRSACRRAGRPRTRSAATSPRSTPRSPTTRCCSRPANRWPASSPAASAGSASSGRSAPIRACTSIRRATTAPGRATLGADALAARAHFRSERQTFVPIAAAAQAMFTIRVASAPLVAAVDERRRSPPACTPPWRACRPTCSRTRGWPSARDRLLEWLAARSASTSRDAAHEHGADPRRRDRARRRRHAALGRLRRRLPPARRRAGAGAPRLPRRRRARRALARARALRRPRDRLRPRQQLPRHLGRVARRCAALPPAPLRLDRRRAADPRRPRRDRARSLAAPLADRARRALAAADLEPAPDRLRSRPRRAAARLRRRRRLAAAARRSRRRLLSRRLRAGAQSGDVGRAPVQGDGAAGRARRDGRDLERGARGPRRLAQRRLRGRERARHRRQARHHARSLRAALHAARSAAAAAATAADDAAHRDASREPRGHRRRRPGRLRAGAGAGRARSLVAAARARHGDRAARARATPPGSSTASSTASTAGTRASIVPPPSPPAPRCARRSTGAARAAASPACCGSTSDGASQAELQATIDALGLPADYVRALDADAASRLAGVPIAVAAWHFPHGGWVDPRGLAAAWLARAGQRCELRLGCAVASLARVDDRWTLRDANGNTIATARDGRPLQRRRCARAARPSTVADRAAAGPGELDRRCAPAVARYAAAAADRRLGLRPARDRRRGLVRRERPVERLRLARARQRPPRQPGTPRPPRRSRRRACARRSLGADRASAG